MFLTDAEVEQMSGCRKGRERPSTLRRWLERHDFVEDTTFFKRVDGWYSVMSPNARIVAPDRPRLRIA
jgi:hypothetical protein